MYVSEYTVKFEELSRFVADYVATDKMKKNQFERGLDPRIR